MDTDPERGIDALLARYASLVEHVETLAFPLQRSGAAAPPDTSGWSGRRRLLYRLTSPLLTTFSAGSFEELVAFLYQFGLVGIIWIYGLLTWAASAVVLLDHSLGNTLSPANAPVEVAVWGVVLLAGGNALFPLAYLRWIAFWRDARYSRRARRILTLLFLICVAITATWLIVEHSAQFVSQVVADGTNLALFVAAFVCFIIPVLTFFYMLLVDTLALGMWLVSISLRYFWSLHNPLPRRFIRELATQPITWTSEEDGTWRMADLSPVELRYLRKWAEANRDATDKRLLPTALVLAALGLFVSIPPVSGTVGRGLTRLFHAMTDAARTTELFTAIGAGIIFWFGVVLVLAFFYVLVLLFRNLATQSLIIEACLVCEYAGESRRSASTSDGLVARLLQ